MEAIKGIYHPDKLDAETFIANFTIRLKEFANILDALKKQKKKPLQHFLITGKRGMGKSTLLRRVFLETQQPPLSDKLITVRLGTEQYKLSRLYKLWEEVIKYLSIEEPSINIQREKLSEEKRYEENIIQIIVDYLTAQNKTLLLLIDNFDRFIDKLNTKEQHTFREILMQYPIQIIGNSVFYDEHFYSYDKPFYDFFKPIHLKNLDKKEAGDFIRRLADNEGIEDFKEILKNQKGKVESLRILSGGVPRTLVILLSILSKKSTGDAIDYLNEMLEQVTPLYQDRMKALSSQQQEILHQLAIHWDRTPVKALAKEMRLPSKGISAQLSQLEGIGYINKINTSNRNLLYEIDERFFNIWLLMSEASVYDANRVIWLTRWLDMFYNSKDLEDYAFYCTRSFERNKQSNKLLIVQALSESKKLRRDVKDKIVNEAAKELFPDLLEVNDWAVSYEKRKTNETEILLEEIRKAIDEKNYKAALEKLKILKQTDEPKALERIGFIHWLKGDYNKAEKYYLMAIQKGNVQAMHNIGLFYDETKKDYVNAEKYFLMAVENGDIDSMYNLGVFYYETKKDYVNAEKYYRMAVENGNVNSMYGLGLLYDEIKKDYTNAEKYYLMAVEKGDITSMFNLGVFYYEIKKDYVNAEKYYRMAIENGDVNSMYGLGLLYYEIKKDYVNAEKYYHMAVEHGDTNSMNSLGLLYDEIKKDYVNAEKYFLMAVKNGDEDALNNLAFLYFSKNMGNKEKALELISSIKINNSDLVFMSTRIEILLWNEKIKEAQKILEDFLNTHGSNNAAIEIISETLTYFLVFKQKQILYRLFTEKDKLSLRDRYKPVYFALLHEMQAELPDEYLKMPEEITEPVNDLLVFVKEERKRLGI